MKKLFFLALLACSTTGYSQTKKPVKPKTLPAPATNTSSQLVQEITWPFSSAGTKNKTNVVIKPRPVVVTKVKI